MSQLARAARLLTLAAACGVCACGAPDQAPPITQGEGETLAWSASGDFWRAPLPSDTRLDAEGRPVLTGYPNPSGVDLVDRVLSVLARTKGWSRTAPVFFPLEAADDSGGGPPAVPGAALPDAAGSLEAASPVGLALVSADDVRGTGRIVLHPRRHPVEAAWLPDAGPHGSGRAMLALLPLQGMPLAPKARYVAWVKRELGDARLRPSAALVDALNGRRPEGISAQAWERLAEGVHALEALGVDTRDVAGLSVFTTGDTRAELQALADRVRALPLPAPTTAVKQIEVHEDFCVFETRLQLPVFQRGTPPYQAPQGFGGDIAFDAAGVPQVQRTEPARLFVTIPRGAMPEGGWPTAVMIRTGGGGDRPLIDRGRRDASGQPLEPGEGPARYLARAGVAGVSVDGPHGGLRNVTGGDEQLLIFNFLNPDAMRDNLRQSAVELVRLPDVLGPMQFDVSQCPGATAWGGPARLQTDSLALIGHSMGATIAPTAAAFEPRYTALVLSGAGGSWIDNVIFKQKPLAVRPIAAGLLGYDDASDLTRHDPFLAMLQWAGEDADPPVHGAALVGRGLHVLMVQGVVDRYILPPIANAMSLSLGLDPAGPLLDATTAEVATHAPIAARLPLYGGVAQTLPAASNQQLQETGAGRTAVVIQHAEDGVEDGHEVFFQLAAPKAQYGCFLKTWRAGAVPTVPTAGGVCP